MTKVIRFKKFRYSIGFTLVELMTTIVIVGILSAVAAPAYSEYIKRAKMAEMYVTLGALQQAQIKQHYENGYFLGDMKFLPSTGYLPTKGSKATLVAAPEIDYASLDEPAKSVIAAYYAPTLKTIPSGAAYSFAYGLNSTYFNSSGEPVAIGFDGLTGALRVGEATGSDAIAMSFMSASRSDCSINSNYSTLGIDQTPGDSYVAAYAGMMTGDNTCMLGMQLTTAHNGEFIKRGAVVLNLTINSR